MTKTLVWKDKLGRIVADCFGRPYATSSKRATTAKAPTPTDLRAAAAALLDIPPTDDFHAVAERAGKLLISADAAEGKTPVLDDVDAEADRLVAKLQAESDTAAAR